MAHEPRPPMMREASTELAVEPDEAWEVVSDPTTYPDWLVGAVEIVAVDDAWPEPGSSFRHRVGIAGPLTTSDTTTVELVEAPRVLHLEARARPLGRAHVEIEVRPGPAGCVVVMREGMLRPLTLLTPLMQPLILARNRESLRRLAGMPQLRDRS